MQLPVEQTILTYSHAGRHQICREGALKAIKVIIIYETGNIDQGPEANTN